MTTQLAAGFSGASLKVKRAYRHIDELKALHAAINAVETEKLTVRVEADGTQIVDFSDFGEMGECIPLIVGDCVHNLRSSLDHLWMAFYRQADISGYGYFPFHETRKNLIDAVDKSPVCLAFPDTKRLILDDLKPHRDEGGDEPFWSITKLDKIDKHNLIITVFRVNHVRDLHFSTGNVRNIRITDAAFANNGGFIRSNQPVEYHNKGKISVEISFPKNDLFIGEPVIPTLLNMAQTTGKAIDLFKETFL